MRAMIPMRPESLSVALMVGFWLTPANAHSWYPWECCYDTDCAPVENVQHVPSEFGKAPQRFVTSRHGTVSVPLDFPERRSNDDQMHVCMTYNAFGDKKVLCLFVPPTYVAELAGAGPSEPAAIHTIPH